jgi:hypothetical protein
VGGVVDELNVETFGRQHNNQDSQLALKWGGGTGMLWAGWWGWRVGGEGGGWHLGWGGGQIDVYKCLHACDQHAAAAYISIHVCKEHAVIVHMCLHFCGQP